MGASTTYLNHATVLGAMGRHAFTRMGKLKLAAWLADVEQSSRIVLYVADSQVSSPWTQTCIRQADCILLVTFGAGDPGLGEYERLMVSMKTTARKELILLHSERSVAAGSTRPFLQVSQLPGKSFMVLNCASGSSLDTHPSSYRDERGAS